MASCPPTKSLRAQGLCLILEGLRLGVQRWGSRRDLCDFMFGGL